VHRILITGGRDLPEAETVYIPLWLALHEHEAIIVTYGDCPTGADAYAHEWLELPEQCFNRRKRRYENRIEYLALPDRYHADWNVGKIGGHQRNQRMVNTRPDVVYAFPTPKSSGTWDCVARAWVADIPVRIYHHLALLQYRDLKDDEGRLLARRRLGWGR
jgi:hypothetical protein